MAFDAYDGPLYAYLVSFAFRLLGMNPYLPRLLVLVFRAATVVLTYWAARRWGAPPSSPGDRRVGLWAALLLLVNAHHILFNSHVAWSNDITPFFSTPVLLAYFVGTRQMRGSALVLAGALFGLALQTHPSVLYLAPGLAADFIVQARTRAWLRRPAPYLAALAALVAYAPVLYYNLVNGFGSLETAATSATYAFETQPSLAKALANIPPLLMAVAHVGLGLFPPLGLQIFGFDVSAILFWIVTPATLI